MLRGAACFSFALLLSLWGSKLVEKREHEFKKRVRSNFSLKNKNLKKPPTNVPILYAVAGNTISETASLQVRFLSESLEEIHLQSIRVSYLGNCHIPDEEFSVGEALPPLSTKANILIKHFIVSCPNIKKIEVKASLGGVSLQEDQVYTQFMSKPNLDVLIKPGKVFEGKVVIDEGVSVPSNDRLIIYPGATIILKEHAGLVVEGELEVRGTQGRPVKIFAENSYGVSILGGNLTGQHMIIHGGNGGVINGIPSMACLGIYNTKIMFSNLTVMNCKAEDSISIRNTKGMLNNILVKDSLGDGIDFDRFDGELKNISVFTTLQDGLDFYNSSVAMTDIYVSKAADKGVSIGERSNATIERIRIENSSIGIANKDESDTTVYDFKFKNNKTDILKSITKDVFKNAGFIKLKKQDFK